MEKYRIEIVFLDSNNVELKLYESLDDKGYRSWKMSLPVANALADWWREKQSLCQTGTETKIDVATFSMFSPSYVEVKELDALGCPKMTAWSLPIIVVEALEKELTSIKLRRINIITVERRGRLTWK